MRKVTWHNILAMILAFALLVSSVPTQAFALVGDTLEDDQLSADAIVLPIQTETLAEDTLREDTVRALLAESYVISEDESRRGENYKEYILSSGIRLVTVYPSAVHYEVNGEWREFDNTLIAAITEGRSVYTNTAGPWNIQFPRNLSAGSMIGITTDGYTVQFGMAGELRSTGGLVVASVGQAGEDTISTTLSVSAALSSTAQIEQIDLTEARASAQYPETVLDKLNSRLSYANIFPNTNVVYDLQGSQLKESIVLRQYDASLCGYRYNLDVGGLVPVLGEDQQIDLCDPATGAVVLTMPAPYMVDDHGNFNDDVEVSLARNGDSYLLSYYLPTEWLAEENRAWPVILDPVVTKPGRYDIVDDRTFRETKEDSITRGVIVCGCTVSNGKMRFLMRFMALPELTSADAIINATISLKQAADYDTSKVVEVHKVIESWGSTADLTWGTLPDIDDSIEDYAVCQIAQRYEWNITDIVRDWYDNENTGMMFKAADEIENSGEGNWVQFYSSDYGTSTSVMPMLTITYQNTNGLEDYWAYASASAGRAGTGYVNYQTGNLTWVRSDLGFDGNRMPVSISHIYNSNDAQKNSFGMGYGWRVNYNQTITLSSEGLYVWEDGDGTKHYFTSGENGTYIDTDGLDLTLAITNTGFTLTDLYGNISEFTGSKLTRIVNNQETPSSITIAYDTSSGFISQITDGVGRKYIFSYTDGLLNRISYKGKGSTELSYLTFTYSGGDLTGITNKGASCTNYTYSNHLLVKAEDVSGYYITYAYSSQATKRVSEIKEYGDGTLGHSVAFTYGTHYTETKDHRDNYMRYQFDDWGNLIATHDSSGHTQYTKYALNDASELTSDADEVHQVLENSAQLGTAINFLSDSSFEDDTLWNQYSGTYAREISTAEAYLGSKSMRMYGVNTSICKIWGSGIKIYAGETYTFSAYVFPEQGASATIDFINASQQVLVSSPIVEETNGWVRLQVSYTNEGTSPIWIYPSIAARSGAIYVDCVQLERANAVSKYNLIRNGEFVGSAGGWTLSDDCTTTDDHYYGSSETATSALDANVFYMTGDPSADKYISQTIKMSGDAGDAFVLAGWAKADAVPSADGREFGLKLTFHYTNSADSNEPAEFYASFDPEVSSAHWQYTALTAIAAAAYDMVTVEVLYCQQANVAFFDGIQLYADRLGSSYTYDGNGNIESETDILGQTTYYTYDANGVNLIGIDAPVGCDVYYEYDSYHNVTKITESVTDGSGTESETIYTYVYDDYGNVTATTIKQGNYTQKSVNNYIDEEGSEGNYIEYSLDGNGQKTMYGYDTDLGLLLWVQNPEDDEESRTHYEYDEATYQLKKISSTTDQGVEMTAEYTYTEDLLATLQTKTTTYSFTYNEFDLRTYTKIGNESLAKYTYSDDENHYLEKLDYSNNHRVKYTYDNLGRVTSETYYVVNELDFSETVKRKITYTYDNASALAITEDSVTGAVTLCYYDFAGRVAKVVEYEKDNDSDDAHYHVVMYGYDGNGNVSAMLEYANGTNLSTEFAYDTENRVQSVTTQDSMRTYSYDALDRLTRQVTSVYNGTTATYVITNLFSYKSAVVDGTTVTTNRVFQFVIDATGYDKTYTYEYDGNGNILSDGNGTSYEYDSANQLIRENNQAAGKTWTWTYDGSGNILRKKEYAYTTGTLGSAINTITYTYGNSRWGDVLTKYNGQTLSHDDIGNLTADGTWGYSYEQGRQLCEMYSVGETWTFIYDANGMRIGRTSTGGTDYTYVYNGSQLSVMAYGSSTLYFAYDASGVPMTVNYNGTTYYYATNLQGDVIAILNSSGAAVVQYTYDAWGKLLTTTGSLSSTLGLHNPLRYRGYVYDRETGLYYLQSRYYNPTWGRFISADNYPSTGQGLTGNNMFAYCGNNPVMRKDEGGEFWNVVAGAIIGAVVNTVVSYITATMAGEEFSFADAAVAFASGGITGAFAATGIGWVGQALIGGAVGAVGSISNNVLEGEDICVTSAIVNGVAGFVGGAIGGDGIRKAGGKLDIAKKALDCAAALKNSGTKIFRNTVTKNFNKAAANYADVYVVESLITLGRFYAGAWAGTIVSKTGTVLFG